MILRRVIEHFRKQEWTAIAIDFAIVVIGVFVGIQVSNWNAARADRAEERKLLVRLEDETRTLLKLQKAEFDIQSPRIAAMNAIHPLLFDQTPKRALKDVECRSIGVSHWLPAPTDELPILEEIISTGRFDLITNESVRASLRRFAVVRGHTRRQYAEAVNELFRLYSRHPDAVWTVRKPIDEGDGRALWARSAGDGYGWSSECDFEKMRSDRGFLAEYVDNFSRLSSHVERYQETIAALEDLEKALAAELGVSQSTKAGEAGQ